MSLLDEVVREPGTKSSKIRKLAAAGHSRADIAKALGIRYQHVRNVLVADEAALGRQAADDVAQPASRAPIEASALPGAPFRLTVDAAGCVRLPADALASLHAKPGSVLVGEMVGTELHLYPLQDAIRRAQALVRDFVPTGRSLADDLIADRRREVAKDAGHGE